MNMSDKLTYNDKIGILDPDGKNNNPLTNEPYSDDYRNLGKVWSTYPAYEKYKEILETLNDYQLTFIISSTGSGKTVLIPKYALHYTNYQGKIGITLPKRVVTRSAASFAAKTLDVKLGKEVGFMYKGSEKDMVNTNNKMLYMTDGILIMKFVQDPLLSEFKVIIIDEAHERKIQIDLILLFLKNLLKSGKRPDLRVVIMSATIDPDKYQNYFSGIKSKIIFISGQPNHEITTYFLDKPSNSFMVDGLALIEDLIHRGIKKDMLFFITTSNEALQLCRNIRPKYPRVYCIEVYADMDQNLKIYAESRDKFLELGNYDQKLIMATNVAESSLTIDGLKYVIDSGYELYSYFDPNVYGQVLEKRLITKAQALQRRGRVGRTEPGICYHLLTENQFQNLADYPAPDILKQDITMDILQIIRITDSKNFSDGYQMLMQLMDPPKKPYIDVALDIYKIYKIIGDDGKLTKIGYDITQFTSVPINRTLFLIYAFQMHCAREASIIIAMADKLGGKLTNLFFKADTICQSGCEKPAAQNLMEKLVQKKGDHFTYLKIFEEFKKATDQKAWARKYGIRLDLLNSVEKVANTYFYKMVNLSKAPQLSRVTQVDVKKRLIEALKLSHQHLTAKKMVPMFSNKKVEGIINKDSAVYYHYGRKDLMNKKFIYDEMTNINGNWEYNMVTII
ncbi:HrpA-like helicase [Tupanvirus soda lake]|uniref:RNA helicase n=2 Tax=Tupanvirus TaxID=2094720 RepID=A0A6N1NL84_9VIRU|nr:HrpA-like helicase [Tupanvirus soda lake]QKU34940.1 HrpA-like helicase [Tupanvirus soda lake]